MQNLSISGYDGRVNEILYGPPEVLTEKASAVIYFGGDIQDFKENMELHRDNKNYTEWSLDNTVKILQNAFSALHIIVVRPARMELKTFSCYENFVPCGNCGVPKHISMYNSIRHLELISNNIYKHLFPNSDDQNFEEFKIIGFSKGCVVLNQFLYEIHDIRTTETKFDFLLKIKDMFWLDGGHSGGKNTWITSKPILTSLSASGINVHIHVSPYQIDDDRRPWIRKEEKIFYNTLSTLNNSMIRRFIHFSNLPASISQHFAILHEFHKKYNT